MSVDDTALIRCVAAPDAAAEEDTHLTHLAPDESRLSLISSPLTGLTLTSSAAHSSSETE